MRILFMLLAVLAGVALPLQAAVNSEFARRGATILWFDVVHQRDRLMRMRLCDVRDFRRMRLSHCVSSPRIIERRQRKL